MRFTYLKFILFLSVLFAWHGCKNKEANVDIIHPNEKPAQKRFYGSFVILGTSDDRKALDFFSVINNSYFYGSDHKRINKTIEDNSLKIVADSITLPGFFDVWAFSNTNTYRSTIYVDSEMDTVKFEIKNGSLRFYDKNAILHNFYSDLFLSTRDYFGTMAYNNDIQVYKDSLKSIYLEKLNFLNNYIQKNNITSNNYIKIIKGKLKNDYLLELVSPRVIPAVETGKYYGDPNQLISIIEKEYASKNESLFNFKNYFDDIVIEDFNTPEMLNTQSFKDNIVPFVMNYFDTSTYAKFTKEKFLAEKKIIEENFESEIQTYAVGRLIREYHRNGFGVSDNNSKFFRETINRYMTKLTDSTYIEAMQEIKEDLGNYNLELSEASLNTNLISRYGDTLTLKEIFSRSNKRIKVVDFWASWCPPCIKEIISAKSFKDRLAVEKNVDWIYLSIDDNKNSWLRKSIELKSFLNTTDQYLINEGNKSALVKELKVDWIPRYIIFNNKNKIIINNSPLPSDSIIFKKIIDEINLN